VHFLHNYTVLSLLMALSAIFLLSQLHLQTHNIQTRSHGNDRAQQNSGVFVVRAAVAMHRCDKNASSITERLFSARSVPRGYKKDKEGRLSQLSFATPAC
jgi:hypothetical protein